MSQAAEKSEVYVSGQGRERPPVVIRRRPPNSKQEGNASPRGIEMQEIQVENVDQ